MSKQSSSAACENKDRELLHALHDAAGRPFPGMLFLLVHYAEPKQIIGLLDHLLKATGAPRKPKSENGREALSRVLEAFDRIVTALGHYEGTRIWQHRPSREGPAMWKRLVDRPTRQTLETLLARSDLRAECLSRLWSAACDGGYLRVTAEKRTQIKVRGKWREASSEPVSAWGLAEDQDALREVATIALKALNMQASRPDHLRRFRELRQKPTEKRFRSVLRRAAEDTCDEFNRDMVQWAARRLKLISDDLTDHDVDFIAAHPKHVRAVASLVCERFASRLSKKIQDKGFERFGLEACRIYDQLTGKKITYSTSTRAGADRPAEKRFGSGLNVVLAALHLIDPNATVSQAQRMIDIHCGWRRPGSRAHVPKQRM